RLRRNASGPSGRAGVALFFRGCAPSGADASRGNGAHPTPVADRERTRLVVALVAALVGVVWIAQGLGAPIGDSFMIGDLRWTAAGVALIGGATLFAWRDLTRR